MIETIKVMMQYEFFNCHTVFMTTIYFYPNTVGEQHKKCAIHFAFTFPLMHAKMERII